VTILRTDYAAVNARGVTLYTFNDGDKARAWVRDNLHRHVGARVVVRETVERPFYTPRQPAGRTPVFA